MKVGHGDNMTGEWSLTIMLHDILILQKWESEIYQSIYTQVEGKMRSR